METPGEESSPSSSSSPGASDAATDDDESGQVRRHPTAILRHPSLSMALPHPRPLPGCTADE